MENRLIAQPLRKQERRTKKHKRYMKDLGIILVILGALLLIVYSVALPQNWLLIAAVAIEVIGILAYILINRFRDK